MNQDARVELAYNVAGISFIINTLAEKQLSDGMKDAFEIIMKSIETKATDLVDSVQKAERMLIAYLQETGQI